MDQEPVYLLDANIFIQAAREYYAFDLVPPYWDALLEQAKIGHVLSIDRVKDELERGNDQLKNWASNQFYPWFKSTNDQDVFSAYSKVMEWSKSCSFHSAALAEFARNADGWLIAYALAKGYFVVTHEIYDRNIKNRVKIPNGCVAFNIPYLNTYKMLRNLKIKFE
jgi:hypothetical protein